MDMFTYPNGDIYNVYPYVDSILKNVCLSNIQDFEHLT